MLLDEYTGLDYRTSFFYERLWAEYFDQTQPGLIRIGTGLPLSGYYAGPWA